MKRSAALLILTLGVLTASLEGQKVRYEDFALPNASLERFMQPAGVTGRVFTPIADEDQSHFDERWKCHEL